MAKSLKRIREIIQELESRAPVSASEDWDNPGLLLGDPDDGTAGAIISIDLTRAALEAALQAGFKLIVIHHPAIFPRSRGLSRVIRGAESALQTLLWEAAGAGISVYCSHTNFDRCALEVSEQVASALGLTPRGRLLDAPSNAWLKLVVYVPESHAERVRTAVCDAGAGRIGNYDHCTFGVSGEGSFRGDGTTQPYLGQPGQLERAREIRLETVLPRGMEARVLSALRKAHPYEEIAYDLYALEQAPPSVGLVSGLGYGVWGEFPQSKSFSEVQGHVRDIFKIQGFWLTGAAPKKISKIAFVAGKGASFVNSAVALGCDLMITGEVGYHSALDGSRKGLSVLEIGHRESERFFLKVMSQWLKSLGLKTELSDVPVQKIISEDPR